MTHHIFDDLPLFTTVHANPRQRDLTDVQINQSPAEFADDIVVLLWDTDLENVEFAFVQPDALVEPARALIFRFCVRKQNLGWAVFQHDISDL